MYSYYRLITIDQTKVGEDDADFAFLFNSTIAELATVGNGGKIENTDATGGVAGVLTVPADLVFSPNANGSNRYAFEVEYYDETTGKLIAWVRSGVSSAADTELYVVYGDAGVVTSQEDVPGTWESPHEMVHHMADTTTSSISDSTDHDLHGAKKAADEPTLTPEGQIGDVQGFDGSNDYIDGITIPSMAQATYMAWIKTGVTGWDYIMGDHSVRNGSFLAVSNAGVLTFAVDLGGEKTVDSLNPISDNVWHQVFGVYDGSSILVYLDGLFEDSLGGLGGPLPGYATFTMGSENAGGNYFNGLMDEVRICSEARTADYVTTCFNNQDDPATFYSVGDEGEPEGYGYYRLITIDHLLVGEDDADFAFLFRSTVADLATVGNGGHVENTTTGGASGTLTVPADLVFAADNEAADTHNFEVQYYDETTGELIAWVQSGVSSVDDTLVYLLYGDVTVVVSQEDVPDTWDSEFKAVWHLVEEADGTPDEYKDSSGNANDAEGKENIPTRAAGQIGYCQTFDGGDSIEVPHSVTLDDGANGPFTVEMWINMDDTGAAWGGLFFKEGSGAPYRYGLAIDDLGATYRLAAYGGDWRYSGTGRTYGTWYYVAFILASGTITFYVNAAADGSGAYTPNDTALAVRIGDWSGTNYHIEGEIDELRVSDVGRTSDYLTTVYNTGLHPTPEFYDLGNEIELGGEEAAAAILAGLLADGQLPAAAAMLYTVPENRLAYIRQIILHNTDVVTRECTLWFVEAITGDTRVLDYIELAAGYTHYFDNAFTLTAGDAIKGDDDSGGGDVTDYTIHGAIEA